MALEGLYQIMDFISDPVAYMAGRYCGELVIFWTWKSSWPSACQEQYTPGINGARGTFGGKSKSGHSTDLHDFVMVNSALPHGLFLSPMYCLHQRGIAFITHALIKSYLHCVHPHVILLNLSSIEVYANWLISVKTQLNIDGISFIKAKSFPFVFLYIK